MTVDPITYRNSLVASDWKNRLGGIVKRYTDENRISLSAFNDRLTAFCDAARPDIPGLPRGKSIASFKEDSVPSILKVGVILDAAGATFSDLVAEQGLNLHSFIVPSRQGSSEAPEGATVIYDVTKRPAQNELAVGMSYRQNPVFGRFHKGRTPMEAQIQPLGAFHAPVNIDLTHEGAKLCKAVEIRIPLGG